MGQQEVINFLIKQKNPLSSGEIARLMNESPSKINHLLRVLLKFGDIKAIEINRFEAIKRCGSRRRMSLYYFNE